MDWYNNIIVMNMSNASPPPPLITVLLPKWFSSIIPYMDPIAVRESMSRKELRIKLAGHPFSCVCDISFICTCMLLMHLCYKSEHQWKSEM